MYITYVCYNLIMISPLSFLFESHFLNHYCEKKKKQVLKPSFNFDRLEEEACFHRRGIVKICLSPHHMASNEPDT